MNKSAPIRKAAALHRPYVTVVSYDGVDELDLFGLYSVVAKARDRLARFRLVAPHSPVTTSGGVQFIAEPADLEVGDSDILLIPGGRGAAQAAATGFFAPMIRHAYRSGARIFCCCSGALLLASAIQVKSGSLAIHHRKREQLRAVFDGHIDSGFVASGQIFSIGGKRTQGIKSVDLAFHFLAEIDPQLVDEISERMEIARSEADAG